MNLQEIFSEIINHMLEGMMVHEQLANYFDFLALEGYKYCHDYHYIEETLSHRKVQNYFIEHYNKLVSESQPNIIQVIPPEWYNHIRQDVDMATLRESIQKGMLAWINWEKETKQLYEKSYNALLSINEVAGAERIKELVIDVSEELVEADKLYLEILHTNFDLSVIIPKQQEIKKKYAKRIKHDINY